MNNHKLTGAIGISSLLLQLSAWAEEPLQLESLSISDSHLESASGPVEGYRATRSATATRTDTDIRDTPQTIEVIPSQVLEDLGSTRIDRALDFAGGVSRQNNFGGLTFYNYSVRGFSTGELYRNGFAINRGSYSAPDTGAIERIEVLKGPSASLYGRGDPGGLVNIVRKRPQDEAFTRLDLSAGSWDRYRTSLDSNTPLRDDGSLLSRINLAVEDNGSFRDHVDSRRQIVTLADLAARPGHHAAAGRRAVPHRVGVRPRHPGGERRDGRSVALDLPRRAERRQHPQRQPDAAGQP